MEHIETIAAVRAACGAARAAGRTVGLVPTMGALHEGHRSLLDAAREATDLVVASIFVNPLQFGRGEDLERYPRPMEADLAVCAAAGADIVFAPPVEEMYPRPARTTVHVEQLTADLCGAARPGHFDGVTTVCTKLFSIVGPCLAFFGRKDAQQLAVVTRMVADLDLPVTVVGCPLVREPDGLALSSRNAYLTPAERADATVLARALFAAADAIDAGECDASAVRALVRDIVGQAPSITLEYVELRDATDLTEVAVLDRDALLALAARTAESGTRLIDNVGITIRGGSVAVDRGTKVVSCTGR